ncbi:MAG: hypothetical protein R3229_09125 [Alphaproteobacteria bacterium]|nr:hypothetical protein [Alphaproteobacteria bacterium]
MSFTQVFKITTGAALIVAGLGLATAPEGAAAEVNFKGKTIQVIINSRPGGGTDASARQIGSLLVSHLPGKPDIIFRNLPGGGGIKANNYFYAKVKPDGLTILAGSRSQVSPFKLRHRAAKYNPSQYRFLGGTGRIGTIIMINKKETARLTDPKARPLAFGGIDGERSGSHAAVWAKEYLGWNIKFVLGYGGTPALLLAARRGEIDMVHHQNIFNLKPLLADNQLAIAQIGIRNPEGKMVPRKSFPNLPVLGDMIWPKMDATARKAYEIWLQDNVVEKFMALPPKTPDDITKVYVAAYKAVMEDPKYQAIAAREFGDDFGWIPAPEMQRIVKNLVDTTDQDLAFFTQLRIKHGLAPAAGKKMKTVTAKITDKKRGGRRMFFKVGGKTHKIKVSGSRTDVLIDGELSSRGKVKVGMTCTIVYPGNGKEAKSVSCKQ